MNSSIFAASERRRVCKAKAMTTPLKTIAELATITPGFSPKPQERKNPPSTCCSRPNIKDGKFVRTDADSYVGEIDRESFRRAIAKPAM